MRDVKWLKVSAIRERPVQHYSEVFWARSRRSGFCCWSWLSAHAWLPCWDGRLPTPFSWCWALASKSGGIHLVLLCPCSASLPLPANLHQHAWLLGRQHKHTFWRWWLAGQRWWLAGQRCRCWREGALGQITVGHHEVGNRYANNCKPQYKIAKDINKTI